MLQRLPSVPLMFALTALASAWLCASMPVYSQEAYYWTYAQHPDLSYFDHPPMVAWLIWLGTALFGDGAIGVRFGTWLCGLGTAWFGVLLLRDFQVSKFGQSLWLLVSMGCPILVVARCLANPDPPLVCFWTLTLLALWRARSGSYLWWAMAGVAAGLALLSKYTAAFLAVGGVAMLLFDPQLRRQLKRPAPYLASRGLKWIQRTGGASMSDKELKNALRDAHRLIAAGLPKKTRVALGFDTAAPATAKTGRTTRASR